MTAKWSDGIPVGPGVLDADDLDPRIIVLEYRQGRPFGATVRSRWDHSKKPWFRAGQGEPSGWHVCFFDFEWCRRDGLLFWHMSGAGSWGLREDGTFIVEPGGGFVKPDAASGAMWLASCARLEKGGRPFGADALLRLGTRLLPHPLPILRWWDGCGTFTPRRQVNPFLVANGDTPAVYCKVCDDFFPDELSEVCDHLEWDDDGCYWTCQGEVIG